mgnify:CR=1 FL=1
MTWKEAWKRGAQGLQKAGVEEYDLDAWYLFCLLYTSDAADE